MLNGPTFPSPDYFESHLSLTVNEVIDRLKTPDSFSAVQELTGADQCRMTHDKLFIFYQFTFNGTLSRPVFQELREMGISAGFHDVELTAFVNGAFSYSVIQLLRKIELGINDKPVVSNPNTLGTDINTKEVYNDTASSPLPDGTGDESQELVPVHAKVLFEEYIAKQTNDYNQLWNEVVVRLNDPTRQYISKGRKSSVLYLELEANTIGLIKEYMEDLMSKLVEYGYNLIDVDYINCTITLGLL